MRTPMMPPPAAPETLDLLEHVTPAALAALDITDHDAFSPGLLPGETPADREGRLTAAADILDDRLSEIAHTTLTADVLRGWAL